ncbi:MAG: dockerin type I domain-containing protein [Chthoniobacterales bacterium]
MSHHLLEPWLILAAIDRGLRFGLVQAACVVKRSRFMFVFNGNTNQWELAGINLAVDGPFSTASNGANSFYAAMFDSTGLFAQDDQGNWVAAPNPSAFYATEIAAHEVFINSVVMQLISVVSEITHGSAGSFDLDLPLTGNPGIECRSSSSLGAGHYKLIFTFMNTLQSVDSAGVASGTGSVSSSTIGPNSNQYTVNLAGVADAQYVTVTLTGVTDSTGAIGNFSRTMGVLIGDTTGDGTVNSGDIAQTESRSGQSVGSANFRSDVTADGTLNSADIALVKSKSGTALP